MDYARDIAAHLGQRRIAFALDLGVTAANNALKRGKFPPAWFPIIRGMCEARGIVCPEEAFGFKLPFDDRHTCPPSCKPEDRPGLPE